MSQSQRPKLVPHLIVTDASRAIDFYVAALGARLVSRFADSKIGRVVHAELAIGDAVISLADEHREFENHAPPSLGGSPVVLSLEVEDAYAVGRRMEQAGARVVFPIADQFYGKRQGRLADPFGHLWIISQHLRDVTPEEIQEGIDRFHDDK